MAEIAMVAPFLSSSEIVQWTKEEYKNFTDVDIVGVEKGKDPLILFSDMEFNIAGVIEKIIAVEKEGYKAAISGCFGERHGADSDLHTGAHHRGNLAR